LGGLLGLAGFFSSPAICGGAWGGGAWGIDGTALVMGALLLAVHPIQLGKGQLAAGFFSLVAAPTWAVSSSAIDLAVSSPSLAAGAGLWAAGLAMVSGT
jgi:hypothetical protein